MDESINSAIMALQEELRACKNENRKLKRQLSHLEGVLMRNQTRVKAQESLSAVLTAEKSNLETYMTLFLDNSPDIMLLVDGQGCFVNCTAVFLQRAGIRNFGLIKGHAFSSVFAGFAQDDFVVKMQDMFQAVMEGGKLETLDATIDIEKTGSPRSYSIHVAPMVDEEGVVEGALMLFHDFTEVLHAKQQAEQASRAKSDFLAMVSHEIRTPMNAIVGVSEMLKKTMLDERQREYLANIQSSSHVLLNLINDILDLSKIEAGKLELVEEYFSLHDLLRQQQSMFALLNQKKKLDFTCEIAPSLPDVVYGDERRVGQIITNVLNNAMKYTNEGFVKFQAQTNAAGMLCFDIEDSGIGMKKEAIPKLFTAFEQLDRVRNKHVVGTGLGLAITKRLCDMMAGSITVSSVYGKGSRFHIEIHLPVGKKEQLNQPVLEVVAFTAPEARVLVVDDIDINLLIASSVLEEYGIHPDIAHSGHEAIALANVHEYDLIFMDHMMPEMDGIEAKNAIRELGGVNGLLPIVALTANAVQEARVMFRENGFSDFISKPIDSNALAKCLLRWLPKRKIVLLT